MTRTIESPIIGIPITIIYDTSRGFMRYYKKYIKEGKQGESIGYDGMVSLIQNSETGEFRIFVWFCDNGDSKIIHDSTIIHESFHIACKIRECMYGLPDELSINRNNEEDWAYLFSEVSKKMFNVVNSMQKQYDKKHEVRADVIQANDKQG